MKKPQPSPPGFFHDSLSDFDEICRLNAPKVCLYKGLLDVRVKTKPFRQMLVFWRHLRFWWYLIRHSDRDQVILVREYSNVPMWVISFGCRRALPRLLLLNHHNLQWALHRRWNRKAMCALQRRGANFLFFELVPGVALKQIGMTDKGCNAIRHPVKPMRERTEPADHDVGFFGVWKGDRHTKEILMGLLKDAPGPNILIGAPNIEEARNDLGDAAKSITFVNTTEPETFHATMQRCRWLCLPYARETHEYRVSGLLSDAVANNVSVLIPDFPMLSQQINWPEPTGRIFSTKEKPTFSILCQSESGIEPRAFRLHCEQRSARVLAKTLEDILENISK
jgi:hypothetical protein